MSLRSPQIKYYIRLLAIVSVVYAFTIQPVILVFELMDKTEHELVNIDWEEGTHADDKEDDHKDKKINVYGSFIQYLGGQKLSNYKKSNLMCRFNQNIIIPPPKNS